MGDSTTTDVLALGLLAFYMFTGHVFWRASAQPDGDAAVMHEIVHDPIPTASTRARALAAHDKIPPRFDDWFAHSVTPKTARPVRHRGAAYLALANVLA
jgi:hypothetical protein